MYRSTAGLFVLAACRMGFDERPDAQTIARVTVQQRGIGQGTVVGPDGFACTGGACTLDVHIGTPVMLRGLAATGSWFEGWSSLCGGNFDCTFQASGDATILADFAPTPNRVFVTSSTTDGAFGGVAAADAICATRAAAAGLSGTFIAYVSDATTNAASRLTTSRGWVRVDGAPYADAPTAFSDGTIVFPPRLDEYGNDVGSSLIYTGTSLGMTSTAVCQGWTSNLGTDSGAMTSTQYAAGSVFASGRACTNQGRLMCVEIGRVVPVLLHPDTGRLAFATKTSWTPGGGRASADALCASEAAAAGLSGNFLAAIATTTESIASRFTAGDVYRRIDGVRLLRSAGLFSADWLDVPPERDALGGLVADDFWTGASRFDAVPTAAQNCNDWSDGTSALNGAMFLTVGTDLRAPAKNDPCSSAVALLCLEH